MIGAGHNVQNRLILYLIVKVNRQLADICLRTSIWGRRVLLGEITGGSVCKRVDGLKEKGEWKDGGKMTGETDRILETSYRPKERQAEGKIKRSGETQVCVWGERERERERETERDRETERQREKQRQRDRDRDRQTDRLTEKKVKE